MRSTNNLDDGYMGSGEKITRSLKKYGKENFYFEILEFLKSRESLKEREKEIVNQILLKDELCMNLVYGGGGGYISPEGVKRGRVKTDNILREKYGDDFRRIISKNYYDSLTSTQRVELNEKIKKGLKNSNFDSGAYMRGRKHTETTKKIIGEKNSINQKGEKNSQFGTCWITNGLKNLKIKKEDLSLYPDWRKGRTLK